MLESCDECKSVGCIGLYTSQKSPDDDAEQNPKAPRVDDNGKARIRSGETVSPARWCSMFR